MAIVYWIRKVSHSEIESEGYVGVTVKTAQERFVEHSYKVNGGSSYPIHNAMRKYGSNIVLETFAEGSPEHCYAIEAVMRPSPNIGWNIAVGGRVSPMQGRKHTEEVIADLQIKQSGENNGFYGKTHSEASTEAQRLRRLGKTASPETKEIKSLQSIGQGNPFYGKTHSKESRNKIREARLNFSPEKKAELALKHVQAMRERVVSDATKEKLRSAHAGRVYPKSLRKPWEHHRANKTAWLRVDELFKQYLEASDRTPYSISKQMGLPLQPVSTIITKFRAGWSPVMDRDWLEFKRLHQPTGVI